MALLNPKGKSRSRHRLERAVRQRYEENVLYKCLICGANVRGGAMYFHLSEFHARDANFRRALSPLARKVLESARPTVRPKILSRTTEQAELDRKNLGRPLLPDATVPGSNLRKIER